MMKKRILSVIIALLAMVGMARAATDYGLTICGVKITSDNYYNIDYLIDNYGFSFDPSSATLTLNNVGMGTWTLVDADGIQRPAIEFSATHFQKFKLKLIGSNYLCGCPTGLELKPNVSVYIEGPGSLEVTADPYKWGTSNVSAKSIFMWENSNLYVRGVQELKVNQLLSGGSGTMFSIICSSVTFSKNTSGLSYLMLVSSKFQQEGAVLRNGQIVYESSGSAVNIPRVIATPPGDLNQDGAINLSDFSTWENIKTGVYNTEDMSVLDINCDEYISTADLVMMGNLMGGTRKTGTRSIFMMHEINKDEYVMGGPMGHSFVYDNNHKTETWAFVDFNEMDFDDNNTSHYSCLSSNPLVATVSLTNITVWGNLPSKGFLVSVKRSGTTNITFGYDDKAGNQVELTVPMSFFQQSDLLASGDKIYGVKLNGSAIENVALNSSMNVPVGTTMRLSIDKDLTYGYDLDTRKSRIACTSWEVTGNNQNVTVTKTSDGYVEFYVGGAGSFSVTAKDGNNNQRMATFVARDVYSYDSKAVYKNGETYFSVPETKISSIFGKAKTVEIEKMVTYAGKVWTIVNHYTRTNQNSELGMSDGAPNTSYSNYTIPIYAQVFLDNTLVYEREDTYITDIAPYNVEYFAVVGYMFNPAMDFHGWGAAESSDAQIEDFTSMRTCVFIAKKDVKSGIETTQPLEAIYESRMTNLVIDSVTGDLIMQGYLKGCTSTKGWTTTSYCYPRYWFMMRFDKKDITSLQEQHFRSENGEWSYMPYALAIAKNKPVGIMGVKKYKSEFDGAFTNEPYFRFSGGTFFYSLPARKDILKYDFSDTDNGGCIELEGTESGPYWGTHFRGITSSSDSGSLYGWMNRKIYKFADDFKSYNTFRTYENVEFINHLKVLLNTSGTTNQEEFIVLGRKGYKTGSVVMSALGEAPLAIYDLKGFDLMSY